MELSVIIPTFNEEENVVKIVRELQRVLAGQPIEYEVFFVDDSSDNTPMILDSLSKQHKEVRYLHREGKRGLASAVVEGVGMTTGRYIIVMDADLQHPPEIVPLVALRLGNAEVVIPSRFADGGSDGGLSLLRKMISWSARTIGRVLIKRMRMISDCTGGFFGIRRTVIEGILLDPVGWKILMEILVKGNYQTVHEIPYSFSVRQDGRSKMNLREQWNYLLHIGRLVKSSPEDARFFIFCMVGMLGVFVNLLALVLLSNVVIIEPVWASITASFIALLHNYFLNERITWRDCNSPIIWRRVMKIPQYFSVCGLGIIITSLFVYGFVSIGLSIYCGQLVGVLVATFWSYSANNRWTWARFQDTPKSSGKLIVTQEVPHELY